MKFNYKTMAHWPPLAWLAECSADGESVTVCHGEWVEAKKQWFCEAVWAGDFAAGDFDKTDIVAGSGGRIRDDGLCFVSSGSNVDRLHSLRWDGVTFVSNSLICLLAWVDGSPELDYLAYSRDFSRYRYTVFGDHTIDFPSTAGRIDMTYFANLLWDGDQLVECEKPCGDRHFGDFDDYHGFLQNSLRLVADNANDAGRSHPFKLLSALSNGYDSPTVAALARELSHVEAFTIKHDHKGMDDSGEAIAVALGIPCHVVERNAWRSVDLAEIPFIASSGSFGDLGFRSAETLLRGSVLLSAPCGDTIWMKNEPGLSAEETGDGTLLGCTEYRLWTGFINCPVPFWGVRQIHDIVRISRSAEMGRWDNGVAYSRPICRRIVEGAGVARSAFGVSKRGVSVVPAARRDFLSPSSLEDLLAWLGEQHEKSHHDRRSLPRPWLARLLDRIIVPLSAFVGTLVRICDRLRLTNRRGFRWLAYPVKYLKVVLVRPYYHHHYVVHWAINRAKQHYHSVVFGQNDEYKIIRPHWPDAHGRVLDGQDKKIKSALG